MSSGGAFTAEEQIRALERIAGELAESGLGVLALGSAAVVLRTGQRGTTTKDLDLHAYPVDDFMQFWDALEEAVDRLGGRMDLEEDGASITAYIPHSGPDIPVEFVLGREDFIEPEVLQDAVETAEEREGILLPSWEHIVTMKAEAWFDRTGQEQRKYLGDLADVRDWMAQADRTLDRAEVQRLVELRPERKRREMMLTIGRVFEDLIS